jgi:hypothetical protein
LTADEKTEGSELNGKHDIKFIKEVDYVMQQFPENGTTSKYRNAAYVKYASNNGKCPA